MHIAVGDRILLGKWGTPAPYSIIDLTSGWTDGYIGGCTIASTGGGSGIDRITGMSDVIAVVPDSFLIVHEMRTYQCTVINGDRSVGRDGKTSRGRFKLRSNDFVSPAWIGILSFTIISIASLVALDERSTAL